jgi:type VI secretion system protein ImpK
MRGAATSTAHPLMAPMYWACADLLAMVSELMAAPGALPMPAALRSTVEQQLSTMMDRARSAGIVPEDIVDAQYAIVALIDEVLARVHGWPGQAEWRTKPLQLTRFNENTAGENFFRRLAALEGQPHRVHVLQIYFLCMAVGFQGRYAVAGGEGLAPIYDRIGARVAQASGPDAISPHGEPKEGRGILRFEAPLVRLGLGFFAAALLVFIVLRVVLGLQVREATRPMHDYANATGAAAAPGKR